VLVGVLLFEIKYVSNGLIIDVLDLELSGKEMGTLIILFCSYETKISFQACS